MRYNKEKQTKLKDFIPKEKKTYSQDWHAYNSAQTREKVVFLKLLKELIDYLNLKEIKRVGRPGMPLDEMLFCLAVSTYCGRSSRRTVSELTIAQRLGLITQVPHFNTLLKYFKKREIKQLLERLIRLSSLPLRVVEEDFAVDSSGFSTSVYGEWKRHKWNGDNTHKHWMKARVISGVKTNVITHIIVTNQHVADSVKFKRLVESTGEDFIMREVSADKAYSSRKNLQLVSDLGAIPFIPFKKNTTGNARGCQIWRQMWMYFMFHEDDFNEHYHKRSNAETVFAMMKRKFTHHLKTRNEESQANEVLTIALCHNICVLIQEIFELKLDFGLETAHKLLTELGIRTRITLSKT